MKLCEALAERRGMKCKGERKRRALSDDLAEMDRSASRECDRERKGRALRQGLRRVDTSRRRRPPAPLILYRRIAEPDLVEPHTFFALAAHLFDDDTT